MNWDDYRFFLAVSRAGSLKGAAETLLVDQATVGRRLSALQAELGAKLLEKRSDGFFLTAAGNRILSHVEAAEEAILAVDRAILGRDERVEGTVRLAMPGALANQWLIRSLGPLFKKYPKLELQFLTGPEVLNFSRGEADLAVRLVRPQQKDLKARRIGGLRLGLYAQKDLEVSKPQHSPFVGLFEGATSELEAAFLRSLKFAPRYCLRSAAWESVYTAVKAGVGMGILPTFMADGDRTLKLLQEDRAEAPLWLVVHPEVAESARVRATIDHLAKVLSP